jgi:hypothetical protein
MAGHDGKKPARSANVGRRLLVGMGAGAGVFLAAAAMATGSAVTAAPAHADFEDLLDPIIQPILTSLTDSIGAFDPAAAVDLTSWTDSFLASLNSIDLAVPAAAEPGAVAAAVPAADPTTGTYDIPITVQEDTEPTVQATVDGASTTLLVDTGSSGLVIPYTDLGSNFFTQLESLFHLGLPTGIGESGYSGGVDYVYLTYDTSVDYGNGTLDTTGTPVDVEIFSWPTSLSSPANFQDFLSDNDSTGILGIGDRTSDGGPTVSPLEADGYDGVLVDLPQSKLIVEPTDSIATGPLTPIATLDGAPIPTSDLTEVVKNSADQTVGSATVSDDVDSGGVYGTIPSSIASSTLAQGDTVYVYDGSTLLYSYNVGTDSLGDSEAPIVTSGTSIDSGVEPFLNEPIFINYTDDTLTFNEWGT